MTLNQLKRRIRKAWCLKTRSRNIKGPWTPGRPADGQCAVTALVVQDLFGGRIIKVAAVLGDWSGAHYLNVLPDNTIVDLTKSQFLKGTSYVGWDDFARWKMLDSPQAVAAGVRRRYQLLRKRLGL